MNCLDNLDEAMYNICKVVINLLKFNVSRREI